MHLSCRQPNDGQFITPDEVLFDTLVGTNARPYYYNRISGEFRSLGDRAGVYGGVRATRLSRQLVFQYSSFTDPPELYRLNWDGTALSRLTWPMRSCASSAKRARIRLRSSWRTSRPAPVC